MTDISIKNAKPKDRPYKLADGEGMYLLINPDGSRYWRLKYRFEGKEKVLALGVYGSGSGNVPLKLARQKRDEARKLLSDGVDPAAERKTRKRAAKIEEENSFESVAGEYIAKRAIDENLVTGQNPKSSEGAAWLFLDKLVNRQTSKDQGQTPA